jgi:hypothetical protein
VRHSRQTCDDHAKGRSVGSSHSWRTRLNGSHFCEQFDLLTNLSIKSQQKRKQQKTQAVFTATTINKVDDEKENGNEKEKEDSSRVKEFGKLN